MDQPDEADRLYREWFGRAVGILARSFRDLDLAEEAVQDAFTTALVRWRKDGIPAEPGGWIVRTARNRAIDIVRRRKVGGEREREALILHNLTAADGHDPAAPAEGGIADAGIPDERLRLVFTCCHPALAAEARIALTLRLVIGLTVEEIARAYLATPATIAQRLVRAKRRIREAGIPFRLPYDHGLPERLDAVLTVIYLVFSEGHSATGGPLALREDLCNEAIRLARLVVALMPDEDEARSLLALLLLTHARRGARFDGDGRLVTLEQHDRRRYDQALIEEGDLLVRAALRRSGGGSYALQAAIAALHSRAPSFDDTDWGEVAALYALLEQRTGSPVVALNRAVAISFADGPEAALPALDEIEAAGRLATHAPLHAARADVLRRAGDREGAAAAYRRALAVQPNAVERAFLEERLADLI